MAVDYKKEGRIATITINRPEAANSMNLLALTELGKALVSMEEDPEVWVGIITGTGEKAFCAGADIKEMLPLLKNNLKGQPWQIPATHMRGLEITKPLIAAINGLALGGGMEIALACDIRIASEKARMGTPEVGLGLIPGWGGTQRLSRMIPWCKAAELLLVGKPIDAQEAYRIGLVNKIVPPEQVMPTAMEWANAICKNGPLAVRAAKEAMIKGSGLTLNDGLELENALEAYVTNTEDFAEGIKAFAEKRTPTYKAK
ncbi:MAG: enoyl-CoA hydratase-related protein [Dehalococcoidales bacterium]|nr:enoyl-CoA hydratase-related protein [Dehalococcoidales bacterium]